MKLVENDLRQVAIADLKAGDEVYGKSDRYGVRYLGRFVRYESLYMVVEHHEAPDEEIGVYCRPEQMVWVLDIRNDGNG